MPDLFGTPTPVRVVLTFNSWARGQRFDWDLVASNPETGDLLAMHAHPCRRPGKLGPEIARALLLVDELLRAELDPEAPAASGSAGVLD